MTASQSRRQFIQTATVTAAAAALPRFAIGKPGAPANSKINVAVVGASGMGGYATGQAARGTRSRGCAGSRNGWTPGSSATCAR